MPMIISPSAPRPVGKRFGKVARCAAVGLFLLAKVTQLAAAPKAPIPGWPSQLRQDLARLGQMEWRLRAAAGDRCPAMAADIGVTFDDRRAYPKAVWPEIAAAVGLGSAPVIAAVATGSPGERADVRPGDEVVAIAGRPVETIIAAAHDDALAADTLADFVAGQKPDQPLTIALRRAGQALTITLVPVRHCSARFILVANDAIEAHSDGHNVAVSTGWMDFTASDDELALLAGHELGHVLHTDLKARDLAQRRDMEDAADLAGAQLLRCAGYDTNKAADFFDRYARCEVLGFLRLPTHRSPKARAERVRSAGPGDFCQLPVK